MIKIHVNLLIRSEKDSAEKDSIGLNMLIRKFPILPQVAMTNWWIDSSDIEAVITMFLRLSPAVGRNMEPWDCHLFGFV
jgi:hypothetical protein